MDLKHAETQARALIAANGLDPNLFKWNRGKNMMGQMSATRNRLTNVITIDSISLSSYWTTAMVEEEVREVMLHEVAHALTPGHNHNWTFKAKVREIGGTARDSCYSPSAETMTRMEALAPAAWVGTCPNCLDTRKMHRAPTAVKACSACCRGKFSMAFVFTYTYKGRPRQPNQVSPSYARSYQRAAARATVSIAR